jgi:hypothetical protein
MTWNDQSTDALLLKELHHRIHHKVGERVSLILKDPFFVQKREQDARVDQPSEKSRMAEDDVQFWKTLAEPELSANLR